MWAPCHKQRDTVCCQNASHGDGDCCVSVTVLVLNSAMQQQLLLETLALLLLQYN